LNVGAAELAQALVGFRVAQVVGDMRKPRAAWLEVFDNREGLIHGLMHGVRLIAKRVKDKLFQALKQVQGRVGDGAKVGEVGGASEAIAQDLEVAVEERNRRDGDAEEFEWLAEFVKLNGRNGALFRQAIEDVSKGASKDLEGGCVGIDGQNCILAQVIGSNIVEAHDVVGMSVGKKHGIEAVEMSAKGLLTKIGSRVDHCVLAISGEQ
jgi:hypothetical protein